MYNIISPTPLSNIKFTSTMVRFISYYTSYLIVSPLKTATTPLLQTTTLVKVCLLLVALFVSHTSSKSRIGQEACFNFPDKETLGPISANLLQLDPLPVMRETKEF